MSYCCAYTCGACKIFCYMCCCKCCRKEQTVKEEFSLLMLGLSGAGKSSLLSKLCGEDVDEIAPTKGFSIKDVALKNAILHVKEVGGSESIRHYWHHYFNGTEGLIFVVDGSTNGDELECARGEMEKVLSHANMKDVPLLVLVSKTEKEDGDELKKLSDKLDIPKLCSSRSFIIDTYCLEDVTHLKMLLEKFANIIKGDERTNGPVFKDAAENDGDDVKGRL